jgi:tetratricopeptide (TPR) repeat protein
MKNKLLTVFLLGLSILPSCQSARSIKRITEEGFMYAMIYDHDNTQVSGVTVFINGRKIVDSDIQGRFVLENLRVGEYLIRLEKRGYETLEETFYYDPMQVLYFKMINASQLLALAETELDNAVYINAENLLNRALLLEPNRPDIIFLQSIVYYLQARRTEAAEILESLIRAGSTDPSVFKLLEIINQAEN